MKKYILIFIFFFLSYNTSFSHVELEYPLGGETFHLGEYLTIRWNVNIDHNIENWDIWYSISGPNGPWIEIVKDYPKGDTTQFSVHEYVWIIPNIVSNDFRIRVQQDNPLTDWDYISPGANTVLDIDCCFVVRGNIVQGDYGYPHISDIVGLVDYMFNEGTTPYCSFEANVDGSSDQVVDISDVIYLVEYIFYDGPLPPLCP